MEYCSVAETAARWGISSRSVRNYCAAGRVPGAFLVGKTWNIPAEAEKPVRARKAHSAPQDLLQTLRQEQAEGRKGGIYHRVQIDLTYNSNHMEGSRLTQDQTRYIYETNTLGLGEGSVNIDDVIETANHFRCVDWVIRRAKAPLTEKGILELHALLKGGTSDSRKQWFAVGAYKRYPNEVGGMPTTPPEEVPARMAALLAEYRAAPEKDLAALLDFHVRFERIHPFQDGNGRVGRLILFKECLHYGVVPFIFGDDLKFFYYRGLREWGRENGYLTDTARTAQDRFRKVLAYFRLPGGEED